MQRTETRYVWGQKYAFLRSLYQKGEIPAHVWPHVDAAYDVRRLHIHCCYLLVSHYDSIVSNLIANVAMAANLRRAAARALRLLGSCWRDDVARRVAAQRRALLRALDWHSVRTLLCFIRLLSLCVTGTATHALVAMSSRRQRGRAMRASGSSPASSWCVLARIALSLFLYISSSGSSVDIELLVHLVAPRV